MKRFDYQHVRSVAKRARSWAMRNRHLAEMPDDLMGMCGIAAGKLWRMLVDEGYDAQICIRNTTGRHCFVQVDGYVVDVTATQFYGGKPIEILPIEEAESKREHWCATHVHPNVESLRKHQRETGWPLYQIAWEE